MAQHENGIHLRPACVRHRAARRGAAGRGLASVLLSTDRARVIHLAAKYWLPAIYVAISVEYGSTSVADSCP
jgi:hypothetical protein